MQKKISIDEIYNYFLIIQSHKKPLFTPENIFESIESQFSSLDPSHQQNFLTFIVENYSLFQKVNGIVEKIKSLGNILFQSDQLSSKSISLTILTKLWLQIPEGNQGIVDFTSFLYRTANDNKEIPHIRNICSQCILEIYHFFPKIINFSIDQIVESSKNILSPTAFPELALSMNGPTSQLAEFFEKRWWSMSPFESTLFVPPFSFDYPSIPNDPLLLYTYLNSNKINSEMAISMINNPFSPFGVVPSILHFPNLFSSESKDLFTPFDSNEIISLKIKLLPPKFSSINSYLFLKNFINYNIENPIVSSLFDLVSLFNFNDLFLFFNNYFSLTEKFDKYWIKLYNLQTNEIKLILNSFIQQFPNRISTIKIFLNNKNLKIPFNIINSSKNLNEIELLKNYPFKKGTKEFEFLNSLKIIEENKINENLPILNDTLPIFNIISRKVETNDKNITLINLNLKPLNDNLFPIFGVQFILSNGEIFNSESIIEIPMISNEINIQFEMKPIKTKFNNLLLKCNYYDLHGNSKICNLSNIPIYSYEL